MCEFYNCLNIWATHLINESCEKRQAFYIDRYKISSDSDMTYAIKVFDLSKGRNRTVRMIMEVSLFTLYWLPSFLFHSKRGPSFEYSARVPRLRTRRSRHVIESQEANQGTKSVTVQKGRDWPFCRP